MPAGRPLLAVAAALLALTVLTMVMAVFVASPAGNRAMAATTMEAEQRGPCLAPASIMRRNHMEMLKHDRNAAVHDGIRPPHRTLENCVTCHAVADTEGKPVSVEDSRHFCNNCHPQAAVSIDCFSCHRSTPSTGQAAVGPIPGSMAP